MKTLTKPRKRAPKQRPTRSVKVMQPMTVEVEVLTVRVTVNGESDLYDIARGDVAGVGPCWLVRKVLDDIVETCKRQPYQTDIGGPFGDSCTCPAAKFNGQCKHQDFIRALTERGQLPKLHEEEESRG